MSYTAIRYHDISCGHRVTNHESKCQYLHGHNYRVTFYVSADELDRVGRVLDFGVIKILLCQWLEENWDHRFLAWEQDPLMGRLSDCAVGTELRMMIENSIVWVPFNPTAENMAQYLVDVVGPTQLKDTGAKLYQVQMEETRKCSALAVVD